MRIIRFKKFLVAFVLALLFILIIISNVFINSNWFSPKISVTINNKQMVYLQNRKRILEELDYQFTSDVYTSTRNSLSSLFEIRKSERAIVYLVHTRRIWELVRSLRFLFANFNNRFRYPVLLFHRGDLFEWLARIILRIYLSADQMELIEIHEAEHSQEFPSEFNMETVDRDKIVFPHLWPNYQHMCAFWFRHVFLQPRLRNVKYIMRLDTDSVILSNISYNIFDFMEKNNIKYGFKYRQGENDCCAKKMVEYVYKYANHYSLLDKTSNELSWLRNMNKATLTENPFSLNPIGHQPDTYYTNFEVINLPAFRDDAEVWRFIDTTWHDPLLNLHGIYTLRWGDAPLRFQTIHLHSQMYRNLHAFCDLHYHHRQGFPATCNWSRDPKGDLHLQEKSRIMEFKALCALAHLQNCS